MNSSITLNFSLVFFTTPSVKYYCWLMYFVYKQNEIFEKVEITDLTILNQKIYKYLNMNITQLR